MGIAFFGNSHIYCILLSDNSVTINFLAAFFYFIHCFFGFFPHQWCWLIIIISGFRRYPAWDDFIFAARDISFSIQNKLLLKNKGVHLCRMCIASKTEVSQTIGNHFPFIFINALYHMWVMSHYYICAFINGQMCQCHLILIRYCHQFIAPVKYRNNDIHILIF